MSDRQPLYDDDRLVEALRAAIGTLDRPPDDLVEMAKQAYTWRSIDAELAALTYDSAADGELVGVRGASAARTLTFEFAHLVVDVEVSEHDTTRDVLGQVAPAAGVSLLFERPSGTTAVALDDLGRFRLAGVDTGPARFRISGADGIVTTEWVTL